jgi:hypothetical protein
MNNYLRTLAGDLLNLEVNTILKENTTAEKMPSCRRKAILDIADGFRLKMATLGYVHYQDGSYETVALGLAEPLSFKWWYGGEFSFVEIMLHSRIIIERLTLLLDKITDEQKKRELHGNIKIVERFQAQSSNIVGMFKQRRAFYKEEITAKKEGFTDFRVEEDIDANGNFASQKWSREWNNDLNLADINTYPDLQLSPEEITLIRKVWEIGSQQILLQTVIQIDGDVTSYIASPLLDFPTDLQRMILGIHNDAVGTSTKAWHVLFTTIIGLAGKAIDKIFAPTNKG